MDPENNGIGKIYDNNNNLLYKYNLYTGNIINSPKKYYNSQNFN